MASSFVSGLPTVTIPKWEMPIHAEHITRVRTVEKEDFESIAKVLGIWTRAYALFPKRVCSADGLSEKCQRFFIRGKVLIGEDSKGIVQVFARVMPDENGLYVEELFAAPWNSEPCRKHLEDLENQEIRILLHKQLEELAEDHKVSIAELTTPHQGSGTIMMYALCHFAMHLGKRKIELFSTWESLFFYFKIGMEDSEAGTTLMHFDISHGVPGPLEDKVKKYFLKHAA